MFTVFITILSIVIGIISTLYFLWQSHQIGKGLGRYISSNKWWGSLAVAMVCWSWWATLIYYRFGG